MNPEERNFRNDEEDYSPAAASKFLTDGGEVSACQTKDLVEVAISHYLFVLT
jgi:hypothetical protein